MIIKEEMYIRSLKRKRHIDIMYLMIINQLKKDILC